MTRPGEGQVFRVLATSIQGIGAQRTDVFGTPYVWLYRLTYSFNAAW